MPLPVPGNQESTATPIRQPPSPVSPSRVLATLGVIALACVSAFAQETLPVGGTWKTVAPAPTMRTEVVAAALGGKIYVIGGFHEPSLRYLTAFMISDTVEEYDPATDRWATKASLPAGVHHAGAGTVGGRLYVIGGFTRSFFSVWDPVASAYMYQPETDSWTERAPMPTPRGALAVAESGGLLYAIGGYDGSGNSAALEVYDPATNTWKKKAPLPTPRDHLAAATVGGKVYAIGGRLNRDYGRNLAIAEAYDPVTDRWTPMAYMPTARSGITAAVIRDFIYVLGGESPDGTFRTNEAYWPRADRWQPMAPLPTGRHGLGSAAVNDRLYVIAGGPTPGGSFSNVNELFVPPISQATNQPEARASAKQVGTIMALLAVFQDAGSLPPESSPEADRLTKALIQFQAAFMKSSNPEVRRWLTEALFAGLGNDAPAAVRAFRSKGWNSRTLEAVVDYAATRPVWNQRVLIEGFQAYNVGRSDFELLAQTFRTARSRLAARGEDLHQAYAARQGEMPGFRNE